jgi:branched-chain amino acid transport system permease protein
LRAREIESVPFLAALLVDGALAGVVYALVGLAFVVVYKGSRMINFALGESVMLGSRLVASGLHVFGLGLLGAVGLGVAGMVAMAVFFNRVVLRRLVGQPLIASVMVTLGLGTLIRGSAALVFAGVPAGIALPFGETPLTIQGLPVSTDRLAAAAVALLGIAVVGWVFHGSRTGVALRAIADDQQVAMAVGIDIQRHVAIMWAIAGVLCVLAGTLWTAVSGGGFSLVLLGVRVFPIVIIGGLDSIPGTIVAAILVGVLESVTAGYVDPLVGGGFSVVASYLVLVAMLIARPHGLFGRPAVERV